MSGAVRRPDRRWLLMALPLVMWRCGGIAAVDPPEGDAAGAGGDPSGSSSSAGAGAAGGDGPVPIEVCDRCGSQDPQPLGLLPDPLNEISGLAPSAVHDGLYWAHNDSGGLARLFLLNVDGTLAGEYAIAGAEAVDWEDIAVGPCPAGSCVYIGDFGDNNMQRDDYVIYRATEPATTSGGTLNAEAFAFSYPDGSHDAESLFWAEGALHIITKQLATVSQVFRLPPLGGGELVAEELLGAFFPPEGVLAVTGADANEQGVLVRTYTSLWFYRTLGVGVVEGLSGEPCSLPVSPEGQGEAVAWRRDALGYVTASEGGTERLNQSTCP